ncbi:nuclear transport factor 2 family protein [Actinorugispora endophytica]|uniref:SnoaL-like protein n=1 Tax=Actinorugispora endophytica TaxID=1605990 RepID=A0A4V3D8F9_9ACTN|nr:nuclear transport factor 2 family protein [Actinorugispora endophytica]TDQ51507.1 SnoaL-like protein [Actinorugispora endophytica]
MSLQEELRHAIEDRDADALVAKFTDDADYTMIDQTRPPSAPMRLHGRPEIEQTLREVFSRDMTHQLEQCVVEGDHAAYVERCSYPDGTKVMSMSMLDLRDGRIVRQSTVQAWDEAETAEGAECRGFDDADEVREFGNGRLEVLNIGGREIDRAVFQPGWRWSENVKPIAGTDLCMFSHFGHVMSGTLHVRMADGTEIDCGPGDVMRVAPGHDAWVVGDEAVTIVDWEQGKGDYAKPGR